MRDNRHVILQFFSEEVMANTRLSMRRIKEVLRLHFEQKRSRRLIAQTLGASPTTVGDYITRAQAACLSYPLPENLDDDELDRMDMAADQQLNSRLGCQAVITRPGDYVVEIPKWNRNYVSEGKPLTLAEEK